MRNPHWLTKLLAGGVRAFWRLAPQRGREPERHLAWFARCLSTAVLLLSASVHAQQSTQKNKHDAQTLPPAVLLATAGAPANDAINSVLQAALEDLHVVNIVARPGMDLGAVQLALDCVAESAPCLRAVAAQSGAQVLIAPSLQRTSSEVVLSLLRFDARGEGQMRRVLKRQPGHALGDELLDAIPSMLRDLFGLPAAPTKTEHASDGDKMNEAPPADSMSPSPETAAPLPEAPMEPPSDLDRVPVGPIVVGSVGVVALGTAIAFGVMMQSKQDQYDRLSVQSKVDVPIAQHTKSTGETQATLADVFFAVGGAALIASGIWLAVDLTHHSSPPSDSATEVSPVVGPHTLGLVLTHRGGSL